MLGAPSAEGRLARSRCECGNRPGVRGGYDDVPAIGSDRRRGVSGMRAQLRVGVRLTSSQARKCVRPGRDEPPALPDHAVLR